jgi:predicted amidohydrolase
MHWAQSLEHNLETTKRYIRLAAEAGSDVVLFPEANLTGYDFPYLIELPLREVTAALREACRTAEEYGLYAILGTIEKRGKKFLNLAHVVNPDGKVFYRYAKIHLAGEDERKYCRPGERLAFFEILGHKCTMVICRDGRHPELYRIPAMAGARILFQPSCSSENVEAVAWKRISGRAQQPVGPNSYIYHCVANTVGQNRDATETTSGDSFIRDPSGLPLAEAGFYEETMITARLNMAKATARYVRASMEHPRFLRKYWRMMVKEMLEMQ